MINIPEKKEVKLLTFHCANNYGAVLQCYALSNFIESLGYNVEVIDYKPKHILAKYKLLSIPSKSKYYNLNKFYSYISFKKFRQKHLTVTKQKYKTLNELSKALPVADIYICGSDQIWSSNNTIGVDLSYFFAFLSRGSYSIISYAASMGNSSFDECQKKEIQECIKNFNYISVREKYAQDYIKKEFNVDSKVVLDPVFLNENFKSIMSFPKEKRDYIIIYVLHKNKEIDTIIKFVKEKLGLVAINIGRVFQKNADINLSNVSPEEWLGWLNKANFIITNSFHGVSFSIKFKKNFLFVPLKNGKPNNRVFDLLTSINLQNRIFAQESSIDNYLEQIEYKNVDLILTEQIRYSKGILIDALNSKKI